LNNYVKWEQEMRIFYLLVTPTMTVGAVCNGYRTYSCVGSI
jgi:hypothetical protein